MTVTPQNPFTSQAVSSLRKIEPPIRWLNDAALRKLIAVFELVEEKPYRCELVQPVLSRGDGYGKSHLLGRLIHELDGRATSVSVAPYHDPLTCWLTLLQSVLNELSQPELIHHLPYPPTQLDELAHQLFGFLTVMLADKGVTATAIPEGRREDILQGAFEKWDLSDPASTLGTWVNETLSACEQDPAQEGILVRLLKAATLHGYNDDSSAMNWLLVLHRYASDRADEESREMCLGWMLTNQLEVPAETFLLNEEQLPGHNLTARQQVLDLLALAKLYRPFILCFDQTNSLTANLAGSFGQMLLDLVRSEGAHFSIVTANSNLWESTLLPGFGSEGIQCLAPKMELVGLTREQGRALAEQRLQRNGDLVALQERFLTKDWLQEQFAQGLLGQREFLRRCELRYQELVPNAVRVTDDDEITEEESLPVSELTPDVVPEVPAPDLNTFTAAPEPAPSGEGNDILTETLPPIPSLDIQVPEADNFEPILESPSENPPASSEVDSEAATPEPVVENIPPPEAESIEDESFNPETPVATEPLPNSFSAFTPLVDIIECKTDTGSAFALPAGLLPPAQEEFVNEPVETANEDKPEHSHCVPPLQEVTGNFSEPEKEAPEIAPIEITAPATTAEPASMTMTDTVAEGAVSYPTQEAFAESPIAENAIIETPLPVESSSETFTNHAGAPPQVQLMAPLIAEIGGPDTFEPIITADTFTNPPQALVEPPPTETQSPSSEMVSDTVTSFTDIQTTPQTDLAVPPVVAESSTPIEEASAPAIEAVESISSTEAAPVAVPSIATVDDQAQLREALLQIIKAHRFASHIAIADELRRKMQRTVSAEETILYAQSIDDIHVYADGPNAAFLWQGTD